MEYPTGFVLHWSSENESVARVVILVRVVILKAVIREPRTDAGSSTSFSVNTQRTGGPSEKRLVRVVEIRFAKLHVSREYRISSSRESTARTEAKNRASNLRRAGPSADCFR